MDSPKNDSISGRKAYEVPLPLISPFTKREMRLYAVYITIFFFVLYLYNVFILGIPEGVYRITAYTLFTCMLIIEYGIVFSRIETFRPMGRWIFRGLILIETVLIAGVVYLLQEQALIYVFLLVFDGYTSAVFSRRRQAVIIVFLLVISIAITYSLLWGWHKALLTLLRDGFWIFLATMTAEVFVRQWRQRDLSERLHAELESANERLREYAGRIEEATLMKERTRLAHEIHDTLGHSLTALDIQIALIREISAGKDERLSGPVETAGRLVSEGLSELRRAVRALKPAVLLNLTLDRAIGSLIETMKESSGFSLDYSISGRPATLPERHTLLFYHAARESLTNINRHAPDTVSVSVTLEYAETETIFRVSNIPAGEEGPSAPPPSGKGAGLGLQGLEERTLKLGGRFHAGPDGRGGFIFELALPVAC